MTYYEELGVDKAASTAEIHSAYRVLVRLFHPDLQTDLWVKAAADVQLRRTHEIVLTLTDPRSRRKYDESLAACSGAWTGEPAVHHKKARPLLVFEKKSVSGSMVYWWRLGVTLAVLSVWTVLSPNTQLTGSPSAGTQPAALTGATDCAQTPHAITGVRKQTDQQDSKEGGEQEPQQPAWQEQTETKQTNASTAENWWSRFPLLNQSSTADTLLPANSPDSIASLSDEPTRVVPASSASIQFPQQKTSAPTAKLQALWLLKEGTTEPVKANVFPVYYAELDLHDKSGVLEGHYRALHKVRHRAISPEVKFNLYGAMRDELPLKLLWTSPDGYSGEAELSSPSPESLQMNWWATKFAHRLAVTSGVALLIRDGRR